jgi:hypothetical protein
MKNRSPSSGQNGMVRWWLLFHSGLFSGMLNSVGLSPLQAGTLPRHETLT